MADTAIRPRRDSRFVAWIRPWIALAAAVALSAVAVLGVLPITYVVPIIGVVLALGSPSDYRSEPRPVAARPRNLVLGGGMMQHWLASSSCHSSHSRWSQWSAWAASA